MLLTTLTGLVANKEYREWEERNLQEWQGRLDRTWSWRVDQMDNISHKYYDLAHEYCQSKGKFNGYSYKVNGKLCSWVMDNPPQYIKDLQEKRNEEIKQWQKDHPYKEPHRDTLLQDIKQQLFGS